ncbi:putative PEP-binding protein [Escherichia coli]
MDFFSIGSNDLTQYLLAVDCDNAKVTRHYNSLNPAFLRVLDYAVQAGALQGKRIGLRRAGSERFRAAGLAGRLYRAGR